MSERDPNTPKELFDQSISESLPSNDLERGRQVILNVVKTLPTSPGVYRMLDGEEKVLYVGKAKNLKKRVNNYTQPNRNPTRIQRMISLTQSMEIVVTHTEAEALLLEANLIKKLKPRYNILLRDDKSFPYIIVTGDHAFPQLTKHRGSRKRKGEYFGPFASAGAVNHTLNTLNKAFPLRTCEDTVFANRDRPCLQYQIKRCAGPCADRVSQEDYDEIVAQARAFLQGRSQEIQQELASRMEAHAENLEFEQAALLRDRIKALTQIQGKQDINVDGLGDADIIAAVEQGGQIGIQVFFFRTGQNYGNRAYFPSHAKSDSVEAVLGAFIGQFYANKQPPKLLLISHPVERQEIIAEALSIKADRKVEITVPQRGGKKQLVENAQKNATEALERRLAESASQAKLLEGVGRVFHMESPPKRIEVYDNSHIQGTNAIGGMIVAGPEGFMKKAYRKFNIKNPETEPGDDYAMMREVLTRRFTRLIKDGEQKEGDGWPDLLLIDGGKGQLGVVMEVLEDLGVEDLTVVGVAKGPERNAGRETFFMPGKQPFSLPERDSVLYFLQRLRDEAHRFAIGTHRAKRGKSMAKSALDEVPGIGAKRKKALLHHFGSASAIKEAGIADLEAVDGISKAVATKIYDHFHPTE